MSKGAFCFEWRGQRPWPTHEAALDDAASLRLQAAKQRVALALQSFGEAVWSKVVWQRAPQWPGTRHHPASRAYYKLWEILQVCALRVAQGERTLHLCEAPGGFVQACLDFFGPNTDWYACSIGGPNAPRFSRELDPSRTCALPGMDDVLDATMQCALVKHLKSRGPFSLITADGAAMLDHDNIEASARPLLDAEIKVALQVIAPGGSLVLKFFEGCTEETSLVLYDAARHFRDNTIFKPRHSRPTNSELYLISTGFNLQASEPSDEDRRAWKHAVMPVLAECCDRQRVALEQALLTATTMQPPPVKRGQPI